MSASGQSGAIAFPAFPDGFRAIVVGASGGIGSAIAATLDQSPSCGSVARASRTLSGAQGSRRVRVDLLDEASIEAAAALAGEAPFHLIITAVGVLRADGLEPEKSLRSLDPAALARSFAINAIGPALVIKHFAPLLPKSGPCVLATLSAKVGSISDNRLGGWYAYRASKAALNQFIRTAAIEIARTRPEARVLALHPGTVATRLSEGFNPSHEVLTPEDAARRLLDAIASSEGSGRFLNWDGTELPW